MPSPRAAPSHCWWLLAAALVSLPAGAVDYSKNCPAEKDEAKVMPGIYDGTFSAVMTAKGDERALGMTLQIQLEGKIHLELGSETFGTTQTSPNENSKVQAEYSIAGAGTKQKGPFDVLGGMSFTGRGELPYQNAVTYRGEKGDVKFLVEFKGPLDVSGGVFAAVEDTQGPQDATAAHQGSASGTVIVRFLVDDGDCLGVHGTFTAAFLDDTAKAFEAKGFKVTRGPQDWSAKSTIDPKELDAYREELERKPPKNIVRSRSFEDVRAAEDAGVTEPPSIREAEVERLLDLLKKADGKPDPLKRCLRAMWIQHARRTVSQWLSDDKDALHRYRASPPRRCDPSNANGCAVGDIEGLVLRGRAVLDDVATISQLGLHACSENLESDALVFVGNKLGERLSWLARMGGAPENLLKYAREAVLLGATDAWSDVIMEICHQAQVHAEATFRDYIATSHARGKNVCDPVVWEKARRAAATFYEATTIGCGCTSCMDMAEIAYVNERCLGPGQPRSPKGK